MRYRATWAALGCLIAASALGVGLMAPAAAAQPTITQRSGRGRDAGDHGARRG